MTKFKECMESVCLAFLTAALVVLSPVIVGLFIFIHVRGYTAGNGAELSIVIVFDVICLLLVYIAIDYWLDERDRKKNGLSREEFYDRVAIR